MHKIISANPHNLSPEVTEAVERINADYTMSALEDMVKDTTFDVAVEVGGEEHVVRYGALRPIRDIDHSREIVMPLPYGNTYDVHMLIRAMAIQESVNGGHSVVRILPNNSVGYRAYSLSPPGLESISNHDLSPLADIQALVLEKVMAPEAQADIHGYSKGAMMAPWLAERLPTRSLASIDTPNAQVGRTANELQKDFTAGGLRNITAMNNAIRDSGVTNLAKSMHVWRKIWRGPTPLALLGTARYGAGAQFNKENKAFRSGMSGDHHLEDVKRALDVHPDLKITIGRNMASRILRAESLSELLDGLPDAQVLVIPHYGHEGGDNVAVMAETARLAFDQYDNVSDTSNDPESNIN